MWTIRIGGGAEGTPTSNASPQSYREQYLNLKKEYEIRLEQFMTDLGPKKEEYVQQLSAYKHKKQDFRKAVRDKRKGIQVTPCVL